MEASPRSSDFFYSVVWSDERVEGTLFPLGVYSFSSLKHCERVGLLALNYAMELGWSDQDCRIIGLAGAVHDVGKADISLAVLHKPDGLTLAEREHMKTHVWKGYQRVLESFEGVPEVPRLLGGHHRLQIIDPYPLRGFERGMVIRETGRNSLGGAVNYFNKLSVLVAADMRVALEEDRGYRPPVDSKLIPEMIRRNFKGNLTLLDRLDPLVPLAA